MKWNVVNAALSIALVGLLVACGEAISPAAEVSQPPTLETYSDARGLFIRQLPSGITLQANTQAAIQDAVATQPRVKHTFSTGQIVSFENKNGSVVRDGDIVSMPSSQLVSKLLDFERFTAANDGAVKVQGVGRVWRCFFWFIGCWSSIDSRWPNRVVPYEIDSAGFTTYELSVLTAAINYWNPQNTAMSWINNPSAPDRVKFVKSSNPDLCQSSIGRVGNVQLIELGFNCLNLIYQNGGGPMYGVIRHEMGHAVGLEHEMNRCDRDSFITINFNNLQAERHGQYQKYCGSEHQNLGLYDFESIMHYGKRDGAVGPVDVFIVDLKPSTRSDFRGFPGFCCANVERGTLSNGDNSSIDQLYRIVR